MTTAHKAITAVVFSLATIAIAFILSLSMPAFDANAITMHSKADTVLTLGENASPLTMGANDEVYYHTLDCICPVSLPPTSGEMTETQSMLYDLLDAMQAGYSTLYNAVASLTTVLK